MIYLFAHIVFASAFTLCLKWVQIRGREDVVAIGAINYITAAILIFPRFQVATNLSSVDPPAALTGAAMGACYFAAYFFVIYLIRHVGAASATVVGSLSLLIPITVAAILWNEVPNAYQWVGIAFAVSSLSVIGLAKSSPRQTVSETSDVESAMDSPRRVPKVVPVLLGFFAIAGSSRLAQRAFGHLSLDIHRSTFLFSAFAVAGIASLVLLFCRRRMPLKAELVIGIALGSTNILHTHFLMRSLDSHPGYLIFPIAGAGGLVFTTLIATQLMGERASRPAQVGIGMAVVALVLLNIRF